ncbi:YbaB/EbfC family nucleoid-associated protein [Lentzea sp. NPDC051838]|uniref:YbaB/EbfC family nucleoid-associated protein n=1 Tax=Lentzea sp. NPDC051838 TaxID=3154849 RepID=UPI003420E1C4
MDILDPAAAHEHLAAWKDRIDQVAATTAAMSARLQELRITARDRMAEVTVDSAGKLVELRLTEEIHRAAPDVVARTIMATLRTAQGQLASRTSEIINGTVGPNSATGQAIEATYSAAAGQGGPTSHGSATDQSHPSAPGRPPAVQPRRPRPPDDDDDYSVSVTEEG